ncbi:MAG: class I SAM-dependent methyltransferase [Leptospiraceae bacterium]|nr:class I SAM-dependent methyltransferase [Leptospiraceae bacterium]
MQSIPQKARIFLLWMAPGLCLPLGGCHAMPGPKYFNQEAARPGSKAAQVVDALQIKPGTHIADLGAGGGHFSILLAQATGTQGLVYAIDVRPDFLRYIHNEAEQRKLSNIKTVLATAEHSGLTSQSVDLIFSRNVYHHIGNRTSYFRELKTALRPGGRLVIIDHSPGASTAPHGHSTDPALIEQELKKAGFTRLRSLELLQPNQSFQIFQATSSG